MPRFNETQLILKALAVLKEATDECERTKGPIRGTFGLRFALAYLTNDHDREIAVQFWRAATTREGGETLAATFGRHQTLNCARKFMARLHGLEPAD